MNWEPQTGNPKKEGERATLPPLLWGWVSCAFCLPSFDSEKLLKMNTKKEHCLRPKKMRGETGNQARGALSRDRDGERAEEAREQARKEVRWALFAIECQDAIAVLIRSGLVTRPKPRKGRRWPGQTDRQKWAEDNKPYLSAYKKKWYERKRQEKENEDTRLVTFAFLDKNKPCEQPSHPSASSTPPNRCHLTSSSASQIGLLSEQMRFDAKLSAG